ncbi:MAG: recombinase family protein [Acholeplasmataceae bacterium]|nr:recombinase family protein [Acholeplasmataceae bacterium]
MRELRKSEIELLLDLAKKKKTEKLKVAIYARKSREDETGSSLSTQIEACMTLITKYNFVLETTDELIFQESNVSGFFIEHRKEYTKMMQLVKDGQIDVVLTMKIDRFSRDATNVATYIEQIQSNGAYFIAGDDLGDNTAAGILIKQIMWATNEFVGRRSVEDSMKVRMKLSRDGYSVGGVGNYGYTITGRKYIIEPIEAIVVNYIFDSILSGASYNEVIDQLDIKGYKSRSGKRFSASTIHGILTNERNYGMHIWNHKDKKRRKKKVLKEEFDEARSEYAVPEAIISRDKFDKVQEMILDRAIPRESNTDKEPYLLTGLVQCDVCGGMMTGYSKISGHSKTKIRYYTCPRHTAKNGSKCKTKDVNATHLETAVHNMLDSMINHHLETIGISSSTINQFIKEDTITLKRLNRELNGYEDKVEKLILGLDMINNDVIQQTTLRDLDKYGILIRTTTENINRINDRVDTIRSTGVLRSDTTLSASCSSRLTRKLIVSMIDVIKVSDTVLEIHLKD